jgi:hypothetical protein
VTVGANPYHISGDVLTAVAPWLNAMPGNEHIPTANLAIVWDQTILVVPCVLKGHALNHMSESVLLSFLTYTAVG